MTKTENGARSHAPDMRPASHLVRLIDFYT
jgi:hypothetical protein